MIAIELPPSILQPGDGIRIYSANAAESNFSMHILRSEFGKRGIGEKYGIDNRSKKNGPKTALTTSSRAYFHARVFNLEEINRLVNKTRAEPARVRRKIIETSKI